MLTPRPGERGQPVRAAGGPRELPTSVIWGALFGTAIAGIGLRAVGRALVPVELTDAGILLPEVPPVAGGILALGGLTLAGLVGSLGEARDRPLAVREAARWAGGLGGAAAAAWGLAHQAALEGAVGGLRLAWAGAAPGVLSRSVATDLGLMCGLTLVSVIAGGLAGVWLGDLGRHLRTGLRQRRPWAGRIDPIVRTLAAGWLLLLTGPMAMALAISLGRLSRVIWSAEGTVSLLLRWGSATAMAALTLPLVFSVAAAAHHLGQNLGGVSRSGRAGTTAVVWAGVLLPAAPIALLLGAPQPGDVLASLGVTHPGAFVASEIGWQAVTAVSVAALVWASPFLLLGSLRSTPTPAEWRWAAPLEAAALSGVGQILLLAPVTMLGILLTLGPAVSMDPLRTGDVLPALASARGFGVLTAMELATALFWGLSWMLPAALLAVVGSPLAHYGDRISSSRWKADAPAAAPPRPPPTPSD